MGKFRCRECNYTFETHVGINPKLCPNCGGEGTLESEKSANELLKDL